MHTKQVIIIRKDLNMRKGKMVAQGAHASMAAMLTFKIFLHPLIIKNWLFGIFTKICVSVDSEEELLALYDKAEEAGILCSLILDSGLTEFDGVPTHTAVAIGPAESSKIDEITGGLKLL
ncbi:aminoacyl-tRNA hydrolase [bacterium]|nr:aminoacyl-tRNA hydrolase [bacterium]